MKNSEMNLLIQQSLKKSYSYTAYKELMKTLLKEGKSTGPEQSESLTAYSKLNEHRMKRWDKTLTVKPAFAEKIQQEKRILLWLVISEGWCGDAAHALPAIHKLADLNENIQLEIVLRDENQILMDQFLTNGGRSIPKLIIYDVKAEKVVADWGPRPSGATNLVQEYKAAHGQLDATFKENLQRWYNDDKGQEIMQEIVDILSKV